MWASSLQEQEAADTPAVVGWLSITLTGLMGRWLRLAHLKENSSRCAKLPCGLNRSGCQAKQGFTRMPTTTEQEEEGKERSARGEEERSPKGREERDERGQGKDTKREKGKHEPRGGERGRGSQRGGRTEVTRTYVLAVIPSSVRNSILSPI